MDRKLYLTAEDFDLSTGYNYMYESLVSLLQNTVMPLFTWVGGSLQHVNVRNSGPNLEVSIVIENTFVVPEDDDENSYIRYFLQEYAEHSDLVRMRLDAVLSPTVEASHLDASGLPSEDFVVRLVRLVKMRPSVSIDYGDDKEMEDERATVTWRLSLVLLLNIEDISTYQTGELPQARYNFLCRDNSPESKTNLSQWALEIGYRAEEVLNLDKGNLCRIIREYYGF